MFPMAVSAEMWEPNVCQAVTAAGSAVESHWLSSVSRGMSCRAVATAAACVSNDLRKLVRIWSAQPSLSALCQRATMARSARCARPPR